MKKILFTAVSALAMGAAIAADSTQFGVLQVPSSAKETIVSVPWLESGTDNQNISVSNLVLTSGLSVGDQLMYYKGTGYDCWVIAEDSGTKVKYWTPGVNVTSQGSNKSAASNAQKIPRGGAVILKRDNPGECFYIMGKPASGSGSTTIPSGSLTSPVYALVAPPTTEAADVNSFTWTGLRAGNDQLIPSPGVTLTWLGTNWSGNEAMRTVPAGTGMWFVSRSAGEKTVEW